MIRYLLVLHFLISARPVTLTATVDSMLECRTIAEAMLDRYPDASGAGCYPFRSEDAWLTTK